MSDFLRSSDMSEQYRIHRSSGSLDQGCALCAAEPIESFTHWKVISNRFPYDLIAQTHHMLIPLRHVRDTALNELELAELAVIKEGYVQQYDYIIEATQRTKSIPQHFHLHLIIGKKFESQ